MFELLSAMSIPDGLAEAVDAAMKTYAGQGAQDKPRRTEKEYR